MSSIRIPGAAAAALALLTAAAHAQGAGEASPYGHPAAGPAERTVVIGPGTGSIDVTRLETVELRLDGRSAKWTFDTMGTRPFPLSEIVPGAEGVTVYVSEHPDYDWD